MIQMLFCSRGSRFSGVEKMRGANGDHIILLALVRAQVVFRAHMRHACPRPSERGMHLCVTEDYTHMHVL